MRNNVCKKFAALGLFLVLVLPFAAKAAVIVNDPFTDGARSEGADPLDISWWNVNGGTSATLTVVNDTVIGSGNAMAATANSSGWTRKFVGNFGSADLESIGDSIALSFDFRITNAGDPTIQKRGFRFGLFDSNSTLVAIDGASADSSYQASDDQGYFVALSTGTQTQGNIIKENATGTSFMGGTDLGYDVDDPLFGALDLAKHTAILTITKILDSGNVVIKLDFTLDKGLAGEKTMTGTSSPGTYGLFTRFDEIGFFSNGKYLSFNVDNVKVEFTPVPLPVLPGDFQPDGTVDFNDLAFLSARWLNSCTGPIWCDGADLDQLGTVDFIDYAIMAQNWMEQLGDFTPPTPDPMTWATAPFSTGSDSLSMTAATATDSSGVEYYFACIAGGGHDSGWQASSLYNDTGLLSNITYTYTIKARDLSTNLNETLPSTPASATTDVSTITIVRDVNYLAPGRTEKLDLYYPANIEPNQRFPGVVIIHGGGMTAGDKADRVPTNIANSLAPAGYVCAAINYDLCPTNTSDPSWPTNIQDSKNAVKFLRYYADTYHVDANNIAVIGASAGGQLGDMVAVTDVNDGLTLGRLEPAGPYLAEISSRVQAVVSMYANVDLWTCWLTEADGTPIIGSHDWAHRDWMLGCTYDNPDCNDLWTECSPYYDITPDDPPALILHGTADTTNDYLQSVTFYDALTAAGVPATLHLLPGVNHSFDLQSSGIDLRPEVINFLDDKLK